MVAESRVIQHAREAYSVEQSLNDEIGRRAIRIIVKKTFFRIMG